MVERMSNSLQPVQVGASYGVDRYDACISFFIHHVVHELGPERVHELGAGEAEQEVVVVVGDHLADAVEVDGLVAEACDGGVTNGPPQVEELGHEAGYLEGEDADGALLRPGPGRWRPRTG